jgi:hypothetical protein
MNLCYGPTYFVGDWTHFLKPYELLSMGWFFNTRNDFARPLSQNRASMPLDDDTEPAIQLESWHRGDVFADLAVRMIPRREARSSVKGSP